MTESMKVLFLSLSVFAGCGSNVLFLELLVREDPGCGNLFTFSQFIFVAAVGFIFTGKWGTKKPSINLKAYMVLVIMFFVANVFNNYAFNLNIPMPLHMIFRSNYVWTDLHTVFNGLANFEPKRRRGNRKNVNQSTTRITDNTQQTALGPKLAWLGSLIANMIMGIIILKRSYRFDKYASVGMITLGIIVCTVISGSNVKKTVGQSTVTVETTELEDFFWWTVGIACLTLALFVSARMGIYQETLYEKYGKNPNEALYYTHLLPLPGFLILSSNLWEHFQIALASRPITIPLINLSFPCMIAYLIGNMLTQYLCISSVYRLSAECSSLTVTLVITLRKFVSLIFSILYFKNPFTIYHWIGTLLVFAGTVVFTELPQKMGLIQEHKVAKTIKKTD